MKAVFLDRDGTVNVGTPTYERVNSVDKVQLLPNTLEALRRLAKLDYKVFLVTNQAGLAEGLITQADFDEINNTVLMAVAPSGISIEKTYVCPHGEADTCECRKPKPKLLLDAAKEYDINLSQSWMIGDRPSDVMTGVNAGTKAILVKTGVPTVESVEATYTASSLLEAVQFIEAADRHEEIMKLALDEAELAVEEGNAPFGCVVVDQEGKVVLREHDRVAELMDPTAHGEINAIRALCKSRNTLSLRDLTFYTTSEPCPSCMAGMIKAKVPAVYYGAKTESTASLPLSAEFMAEKSLKYPIRVTGGILADAALAQRTRLLG